MSERLESHLGGKWEESTFEKFSSMVTDLVNGTVVDGEGNWKKQLIHQILSAAEQCRLTSPARRRHEQPKFVLGTADSSDEASCDGEVVETVPETSGVELEAESSSSYSTLKSPDGRVKSMSSLPGRKFDRASINDLVSRFKTTSDLATLDDDEIVQLLNLGHVKHRDLETRLESDHGRAVRLRRLHVSSSANLLVANLPFKGYDYSVVTGACCENVIGYVPIPTGFAGPLLVNGKKYLIPLSTTEGALVASTNRGCKAVTDAGGVRARVYHDGMTRAPVLQFKTVLDSLEVKDWLETPSNFEKVKAAFNATSNYAKLTKIDVDPDGRLLFVRFEATTGDAMGMNMVSKGVNSVMLMLAKKFPEMKCLSLSGNYCVDKKASWMNWIKGRGKSVVSEAIIPASVVRSVLKTSVEALCTLAKAKLLIGSSMAGCIGGWNAHAANVVAAMFLATGQDAAQVVSSSMCLTSMDETPSGDLHISCNMRCLEVGTVGGGTILPAQKACLKMLECDGASKSAPGDNAKRLAEIICASVLAGELSLMAAQCTDDLVRSHLRLNRSAQTLCVPGTCSRPPKVPVIQECTAAASEANLAPHPSTRISLSIRNRGSDKGGKDVKLECSTIL